MVLLNLLEGLAEMVAYFTENKHLAALLASNAIRTYSNKFY